MSALTSCGEKRSVCNASCAGIPRTRSMTRRALVGETRRYRTRAIAVGRSSLTTSGTPRPPFVLHVTTEGARRSELTELVADHALGDEDRHVLATVVDGDGVPKHRRHDHRTSRPRRDDVLGALVVLT